MKIRTKINNVNFTIEFTEDERNDYDGITWNNKKLMRIKSSLPFEEKLSTMFHEWLHVWNNHFGMGLEEHHIRFIECAFRDFYVNFIEKYLDKLR